MKIEEILRNCESLKDMFDTLNEHYDTTAKIGIIAKGVIIAKVNYLLNLTNAKKKK